VKLRQNTSAPLKLPPVTVADAPLKLAVGRVLTVTAADGAS
jgi:hypothetical protein